MNLLERRNPKTAERIIDRCMLERIESIDCGINEYYIYIYVVCVVFIRPRKPCSLQFGNHFTLGNIRIGGSGKEVFLSLSNMET